MCKALTDNEVSTEYATGVVCLQKGSGLCFHLQDLPLAMGAAQESISSVNVEAKWVLCLAKAAATALKYVLY